MIMTLYALTRRRNLFKIPHSPKALLISTLGCKSTIMAPICDDAIILPSNQTKLVMATTDMEFPQTLLAVFDFGVELCISA